MQILQHQINESAEWAVLHELSRMLRLAGAVVASEQAAGRINAFGHRAQSRESWPGQRVGVRAPEAGETALSAEEVPYLFRGHPIGLACEGVSK